MRTGDIEAEYNDLLEEARLCLSQLQKAQLQLEEEVMNHYCSRKEKDRLEKELMCANEERVKLDEELSLVKKEARQLEADLADSSKEAELSLLRLHHVQEELEQYFLAKKEIERLETESRVAKKEIERLKTELIMARNERERLEADMRLESRTLENQLVHQAEKLHWLRGQRELLIRMVRMQGRNQRAFMAVWGRIALYALKPQYHV
jgi:hypothetical protein